MFNLIPTEPFEYHVYADWLEDQGAILTAAVRKGIIFFGGNNGERCQGFEGIMKHNGQGKGSGAYWWGGVISCGAVESDKIYDWKGEGSLDICSQ